METNVSPNEGEANAKFSFEAPLMQHQSLVAERLEIENSHWYIDTMMIDEANEQSIQYKREPAQQQFESDLDELNHNLLGAQHSANRFNNRLSFDIRSEKQIAFPADHNLNQNDLSYFDPQTVTKMFPNTKVQKTSFDLADQACQNQSQRQSFSQIQERLYALAEKIGLDGIATISNEEDFTLSKEFKFCQEVQKSQPWYEQLKDQQLSDLFEEKKPSRPTISHVYELFQDEQPKKRKKTSCPRQTSPKDETCYAQDLYESFSQQIKENIQTYPQTIKGNFDTFTLSKLMVGAFNSAQANIRLGENPQRQVFRFAIDLASAILQQTTQFQPSTSETQKSGTQGAVSSQVSHEQSSQLRENQSSQMRDTLSEIISDTLSSIPQSAKSSKPTLHKRSRKTMHKDETLMRRNRMIADHVMTYSDDQVEMSIKISDAFASSAAPHCGQQQSDVNYSKLKLPTARDLLKEALMQLPIQQGTKKEIIEMAGNLCPHARKEVNHQFFKTLEQSLSKYLIVQPRIITLNESNLSSQNTKYGGVGALHEVDLNLKQKVIMFLQNMPEQSCDVQELARRFGNVNSILRLISRNSELFETQEKIYRLEDGSQMQPPDYSFNENQQDRVRS